MALAAAFICASAVSSATAQQATPYEVEYQTPGNYKDFRFAIGGGYAYRLGKIAKTGDSKIMDKVTVGVGFRHVLNNMAAFGYMAGGGSIKPTTKMWTATVSAGYFF